MRTQIAIILAMLTLTGCGEGHTSISEDYSPDIYYESFGKGEPVLIINGGPGFSSEGFRSMAESVADLGYQTIIYDQRGTGRTKLENIDSSTITMDLMVDDIESLRKELNIDRWVVLGHSFGGMLAGYYATKHPDRVNGMILSSSGGVDLSLLNNVSGGISERLTEEEYDSLGYYRNRYSESGDIKDRRALNQMMAKAYVVDRQHVPTIAERLMQGNMEINGILWRNMRAMDFDCKPGLSTFDKPVLILQGQQDILPSSIAATTDSILPNSRLVLLDNCGHYGWLDQRNQYFKAIGDFLATCLTERLTD